MVIGGMAGAFFLEKQSRVWIKIGIGVSGFMLGLDLLFNRLVHRTGRAPLKPGGYSLAWRLLSPIASDQRLPLRFTRLLREAPAHGAKSLVEGWRRFGIGRARLHRRRSRGLSLGFARRWGLGGIRDRRLLLRKPNDWRPLQFMPRRLDHLSWRFGSPLGDFRWRDQTGFWRVSKRLFAFSRGVHGIEPLENANFQVINRSASHEAKTRGQGQ
jgi:hypothetical protein